VRFSLEALLASITAYGVTVTKVVDALRKLDKEDKASKAVWQILAFMVGVFIAVGFGVNVFESDFAGHSWAAGLPGQVLTGLAIGAAGSGWHEVLDALSGAAKAGKGSAGLLPEQPARQRAAPEAL
jgi:protein-S-isoprenylcysteine O-methyltransferase Ste14